MKKYKNNIMASVCAAAIVMGIFGIMPRLTPNIAVTYAEITPNTTDTIAVSADFSIVVDYYSETVRIINKDTLLAGGNDYIEIYDNTGAFIADSAGKSEVAESMSSMIEDAKYMYALKAVSDAALSSYTPDKRINALRNEKWYPIYGGGFNINAVIPSKAAKDPRKQYYIAVRRADDYFNTQSGYETRIGVPIKPRFNDKNLAKSIEYDAENEKIILSSAYSTAVLSIMYRFDYFNPIDGVISKQPENGSIDVTAKYFTLGGNVYISTMPFKDSIGNIAYARSKEIRFRIPKVPNLPSVKVDFTNKKITSLKKSSVEWSFDESDWHTYEGSATTIPFKDVFSIFTGLQNSFDSVERDSHVIYFRTKAVSKKSPASFSKKILIPASYLT